MAWKWLFLCLVEGTPIEERNHSNKVDREGFTAQTHCTHVLQEEAAVLNDVCSPSAGKCHQDLQVQPNHVSTPQSLGAVQESSQLLLPCSPHTAGKEDGENPSWEVSLSCSLLT